MKIASLYLALTGTLAIMAAPALGQAPSAGAAKNVSRTTKAVNYRRAGAVKIDFQGTELMQQANGEAKVQNKGSRTEIEAKFLGLDEATKFGLEYLTYVLWAVSPGGRAVNLGEVVLKNGAGEVKAISDMQTFGMIVTAEPYFAVTQPGNTVVLENVFGPGTLGKVENIDASYELLGRGIYSSSNTKIENAIFGIDRKTPLELFEARNSVRIAHIALADRYASSTLNKAVQQLKNAEDVYARKSDKKAVIAAAREVVETAEEARVMAVKQKAEEDAQAKIAADKKAAEDREAKARADAIAEAQRRQEAEQARQQAEAAKADALRMQQEAQRAAEEAARQRAEAEKPRTRPPRIEPPLKRSSAPPKPKPKRRAKPPPKPKPKKLSFAPSSSTNSIPFCKLATPLAASSSTCRTCSLTPAATHSSLAPAKNLPKFPASFSLILASLSKSKATRTA
ncbi:MAG: hypothetical protein AUH16_01300 [Acidobacteria bacterium 13_2_20CM_57_7]|nr:MAG: hypothetical protein AUH16_01300 [Acidobacteria bacterium 13_2_20CM_57_7]